MSLLGANPFKHIKVTIKVCVDFCIITLLDYAPNSFRRRMLSSEYQGEALEKRLQLRIGNSHSRIIASNGLQALGLITNRNLA